VGDALNVALGALGDENRALEGVLEHISFTRQVGRRARLDDQTLRSLIQHFSQVRLRDEDFEFPDMLGAAYEYLIKHFADSAGKKGGEFYTPRDVVRLMVRLLQPEQGMRIYDPCVGSGGMLIVSREYVQETGGDPRDLALYGQDANGSVWAICKMNLLLHACRLNTDIRHGDTLLDPQHQDESGELMRFDRVISNPPFRRPTASRAWGSASGSATAIPRSGASGRT
jgi:type I restriction enzyme M protein